MGGALLMSAKRYELDQAQLERIAPLLPGKACERRLPSSEPTSAFAATSPAQLDAPMSGEGGNQGLPLRDQL